MSGTKTIKGSRADAGVLRGQSRGDRVTDGTRSIAEAPGCPASGAWTRLTKRGHSWRYLDSYLSILGCLWKNESSFKGTDFSNIKYHNDMLRKKKKVYGCFMAKEINHQETSDW